MARLTYREIDLWVNNDESLYNWWKESRQGLRPFMRDNRAELERLITAAINRKPGE